MTNQMRVNFMVIGAQKSGTTTLAGQLANHPEICFCRLKEPGYFNEPRNWQVGLDEYHALYEPEAGQLCGEASTMYTFMPEFWDTHQRLFEYNPDLKLIYIMRDPVERIRSNYAHRVLRRTVKDEPETAVFAAPEIINRTRYGVQLRPYFDTFPAENILLLVFEEYIADQAGTLAEIGRFLEIDPSGFKEQSVNRQSHSSTNRSQISPRLEKVVGNQLAQTVLPLIPKSLRKGMRQKLGNKLEQKPQFSPELRQKLWRFLEDDVAVVETLMGRRIDIWRKEYEDESNTVTQSSILA